MLQKLGRDILPMNLVQFGQVARDLRGNIGQRNLKCHNPLKNSKPSIPQPGLRYGIEIKNPLKKRLPVCIPKSCLMVIWRRPSGSVLLIFRYRHGFFRNDIISGIANL